MVKVNQKRPLHLPNLRKVNPLPLRRARERERGVGRECHGVSLAFVSGSYSLGEQGDLSIELRLCWYLTSRDSRCLAEIRSHWRMWRHASPKGIPTDFPCAITSMQSKITEYKRNMTTTKEPTDTPKISLHNILRVSHGL